MAHTKAQWESQILQLAVTAVFKGFINNNKNIEKSLASILGFQSNYHPSIGTLCCVSLVMDHNPGFSVLLFSTKVSCLTREKIFQPKRDAAEWWWLEPGPGVQHGVHPTWQLPLLHELPWGGKCTHCSHSTSSVPLVQAPARRGEVVPGQVSHPRCRWQRLTHD